MKNLMSVVFISLFLLNLFMVGCEQPLYRAIPESIQFKNGCSFDIVVQFDTENFNRGYDFMDESMIYTIKPDNWTYPMLMKFKKYDMIMHDSIFTAIVSSVRVYSINEGDTSFVNPEMYNKRTSWENTIYVDDWDMLINKVVVNYFEIKESMFQN
jgi:hypothetical protein